MTPRKIARARTALVAAGLAAALAGCGKLGELDRPGPLFGTPKPNAQASAQQPQRSEDPTQPVRTIDPRNMGMDPVPSRVEPIAGQGSDPTAIQPPGVLPDPYANPQ